MKMMGGVEDESGELIVYRLMSFHLARRMWAVVLVLWTCVYVCGVRAQSVSPQVSPKYIGGGITAGMNFHNLDVPIYRNDTFCGVFSNGNSILPNGFLTFETPFGDPATSIWFNPRIHLEGLGALITTPSVDQARFRDTTQPGSPVVPVSRNHHLDASILAAGIDLFFKYPIASKLFVFAGPSASFLVTRNALHTEVITEPTWVVFPDTKTGTKTYSSGEIPNSTSILATATLGASFDAPLSEKVVLAPELSVTIPINSVRSDYRWHITTVSLGAAIKFNIAREKEPEIVHVEPPLPPPVPTAKSDITESVKISGVDVDSNGVEHEQPEPQLRVEEFVRLESYPTLNYVFFDSASSTIPSRYHLFPSPAEAMSFDPKGLSGRSSLDVYHDVLNILGRRMQETPAVHITLTGSTDGHEDIASANTRANAVKQYLTSVWNIDPSRINVETTVRPRNASSSDSKEGMEENRRVEITTNDAATLDPVVAETIDRTMNPPKIRLRTEFKSSLPIVKNTLTLNQGNRQLMFFNSALPVQDWRPSPSDLPRTDTPLIARLYIRDSLGTEARAADSAHVDLITIKKKREERLQDKIVEHYNLITFDFDKADVDQRSKRVVSDIARSITPNDNILIKGYTDITGERTHNLQLSQDRAKAVETALRQSLGAKAATVRFETQGEGQLNLVDNQLPEGRFLSRTVFVELQKPVQ